MKTKQENLYFQYEIHILSPTNFFKFTVFYLKTEALNHGLKIFRAFLIMDLLDRDLHESERAYKK